MTHDTIVYVLCMINLDRLDRASARDAWAMWNRVWAAYRRLCGYAFDPLTDRGEVI